MLHTFMYIFPLTALVGFTEITILALLFAELVS